CTVRPGHARGPPYTPDQLGLLRTLTGHSPAAAASYQQALALFGDLGDLHGQGWVLNGLGLLQRVTGDHPAAAASLRQALALFGDLGDLEGQAQALNSLGVIQQETRRLPGRRGQPAAGPGVVPRPR